MGVSPRNELSMKSFPASKLIGAGAGLGSADCKAGVSAGKSGTLYGPGESARSGAGISNTAGPSPIGETAGPCTIKPASEEIAGAEWSGLSTLVISSLWEEGSASKSKSADSGQLLQPARTAPRPTSQRRIRANKAGREANFTPESSQAGRRSCCMAAPFLKVEDRGWKIEDRTQPDSRISILHL